MTATYLVTVEIDDSDSIEGIAEHILDSLDDLSVTSVKPWSRPTLETAMNSTMNPQTPFQ